MIEKYQHLVGKKYDYNGGDCINTFNCATLVEHILDKKLCSLKYDVTNTKNSINAIRTSMQNYTKLDKPENMALVTLGKTKSPHHIGVYMDGYIIHSDAKMGVVVSKLDNLKLNGYWNIEYWRSK